MMSAACWADYSVRSALGGSTNGVSNPICMYRQGFRTSRGRTMALYSLPSEGMDLLCRSVTVVCETTRRWPGFDGMAVCTVVLRKLLLVV